MTKITDVSSKDGLYDLTVKLGTELTNLSTEVTSIQSKLNGVTNIDGMNFQGAAQLISNNLKNVLGALTSLQGTVNSYITELENFDQYENPGVNPDLVPPEMTEPGSNPGATTGTDENAEEEKPEETTPEDKDEDTNSEGNTGTTPGGNTGTVPGDTGNNNSGNNNSGNNNSGNNNSGNNNSGNNNSGNNNSGNNNSGNNNSEGENSEGENSEGGNSGGGNSGGGNSGGGNSGGGNSGGGNSGGGNSGGGNSGGGTTQPPAWNPVQQKADEISFGVGDPGVDVSNYTNNPELGYNVTTGNMSYGLSNEDYNLLCAVVAAESDGTYDGTMSVMSAILNRCEDPNFKGQFGMDPIAQITASNQFGSYTSGEFQKYIGNTTDIVSQAVSDALAGVRNHASCNY